MSTVEESKQRVLKLAREIEKLTTSGLPIDEFFDQFLDRVVKSIGARAGAVWLNQQSGRLEAISERGLSETELDVIPGAMEANERLVRGVMADGQAKAFTQGASQARLPTSDHLIIVPLRTSKASIGAVEIFQRGEAPESTIPNYLQFVEMLCAHACRFLEQGVKQEASVASNEANSRRDQFLLRLHASLIANEVAAVAASDGRQVIGCDRVSVAIRRGAKTVVVAMSGYDAINRRSNHVRALERLIASVIEARKPLAYTGALENLAPQIETPLAKYVQESGARMVLIEPLFEPRPIGVEPESTEGRKLPPPKLLGGLVVEQFSASRPAPGVLEKTGEIVEHVSSALHNARTHERLHFTPVRRMVGSAKSFWEGRLWLKIAAVLALICAVTVALVLIPYDYRVEANGQLMPVVQRSVFAPLDADVVDVLVSSGDRVKKGQPLIKLRNDDLHARLLAARNESFDFQNQLQSLQAERDLALGKADRTEVVRLEGEMSRADVQMKGAKEQVEILEREEALLSVVSPIDGIVVTFEVDQMLKSRPVRRGELLVEVMDDSGPWRLELELEEKRMGHLLRSIQKNESLSRPLEFVLATNVESTYTGQIERIATRADESEEGNIVEIYADINNDELPEHQIGAEVITKINCGKRSLGYVLFGDVVEFLQKYLWL